MAVAAPRFRCGPSRANRSSSSAQAEKVDDLDEFQPSRIANRILGMGDYRRSRRKGRSQYRRRKSGGDGRALRKGKFDLNDMNDQLAQIEKKGGNWWLDGPASRRRQDSRSMAGANVNEKTIKRQRAMILSMTPLERRNPDILKASRKKRIADGSGMRVEDLNRLLKQHRQMADLMKMMGQQAGKRGPMAEDGPDVLDRRRHADADA